MFDFAGINNAPNLKKKKRASNYKPIPLEARIKKISNEGLVTLAFNKDVYVIKNLSAIDYDLFEIKV
jgi:hypothetical protein